MVFVGIFNSSQELLFEKTHIDGAQRTKLLFIIEMSLDIFDGKLRQAPSSEETGEDPDLLRSIGDLYALGKITATNTLILFVARCDIDQGMKKVAVSNVRVTTPQYFLAITALL